MRKKKLFIIIGFVVIFFLLFGRIMLEAVRLSPVLFNVLFNKEIILKKTKAETINILLLGTGGAQHEGPGLTDTIMLASIHPEKKTVTLVSIPRDLWVVEIDEKINSAYAIGNKRRTGGGLVLAKAVVSKITNQPIAYAVGVDFEGFVKAVDLIGGIDIDVERTFDDYEYPIEEKRDDLCGHSEEEAVQLIASQSARVVFPCRYEHVRFDQGIQHMDGKQALIFVRSRYATGIEGSDFARSMRQQKVIKAFKNKVLSLGTLANPIKVSQLYSVVAQSIDTDIKQEEFDDFIKLAQKMSDAAITSVVIDTEDKTQNKPGLLVNPPLSESRGIWILRPRAGNGNYSEIQLYISCVINSQKCSIPSITP